MLRKSANQYVKLMLNARLSLFSKSIVIFSNLVLKRKSLVKMEKRRIQPPLRMFTIIMNVDTIILLIRPLQSREALKLARGPALIMFGASLSTIVNGVSHRTTGAISRM